MLPRQAKPLTIFPSGPGRALRLLCAPPFPDPPGVFPGFGLDRLMVHLVCVVHLGLTTGFGSRQHRVCLTAEQLCKMLSCCLILVLPMLGKPFSKPWSATNPSNRTVARQGEGSQREWLREFPDMPCLKRIYTDKSASVHKSIPRNEKRFSSPWSNIGFVHPSIRTTNHIFRSFEEMCWRAIGRVVSWLD